MKKLFCVLAVWALTGWGMSFGQDIIMSNTPIAQSAFEESRYFYDPGGSGDFGIDIRDTMTIKNGMSGVAGSLIVQFIDFALGYGDTLYIFDGPDCNAPLLDFYNTVRSPEEITATGDYLTFVFHSDTIDDYGILKSGWKAQIYVVPTVPEAVWLTAGNDGLETISCNAKFYDSGGPSGNIDVNQNPGTYYCEFSSPVSHVKMEFEQPFSIGGVMKIYDGKYNAPDRRLIGQWHSTTVDAARGSKPPTLFSSDHTLTVEYIPGNEAGKSGWNATISCVPELFESPDGSACPQVVAEDELGIAMPDTIQHTCGVPIILNAGVTATGRYTNDYTVRQIPFNPPYPFTAGTNRIPTPIGDTNHDDEWLDPISLGFTFSFFDYPYQSVYPGTNALISLKPQSGWCDYEYSYPLNSPPYNNDRPYNYENAIYGVYHDVHCSHFSNHGNVRTGVLGNPPCRTFVFNYDHIALYGHNTGSSYGDNESDNGYYNTYQMVLYEGTNIIDVYVKHCSKGQTYTEVQGMEGIIGLQNKTSSQIVLAPGRGIGWWVPNNPTQQANDEAWRFTPITPMDEYATVSWYEDTISPTTCLGHSKKLVVDPQINTDYIVEYHFTNASSANFRLRDTVHVVVDVPEVKIDSVNVCPGKRVELIPEFGDTTSIHPLSFKWSDGTTTERDTITAVKTDTLTLTVHYDNNCRYTATSIVAVDTMAVPKITGDTLICSGETVRLVAAVDSPSYIIRWANGLQSNVRVVRPTDTTSYVVKAILPTDSACFTTDTFLVKVKPLPELSFTYSPESVIIDHGEGILYCYTDCDTAYDIVWNFNDRYNPETTIVEDLHEVSHVFTHVGTYGITLAGTNKYNCRDSVTEHVRVYVPVSFVMPSGFTPNDDGLNDVFKPVFEGLEVTKYEMRIYDRAGRLVFRSYDANVGWDGRDPNGLMMPSGVYVYKVHYWTQMDDPRSNGQPVVTGSFTLIR